METMLKSVICILIAATVLSILYDNHATGGVFAIAMLITFLACILIMRGK